MKAICIDNSHRESDLTLNKVYDVEYIPMCKTFLPGTGLLSFKRYTKNSGYNPCYVTTSDEGQLRPFERSRFVPIHKIRYDKLNQIGI